MILRIAMAYEIRLVRDSVKRQPKSDARIG
jgi:hypothetical protein